MTPFSSSGQSPWKPRQAWDYLIIWMGRILEGRMVGKEQKAGFKIFAGWEKLTFERRISVLWHVYGHNRIGHYHLVGLIAEFWLEKGFPQ
jgi:hypothetical protein